MFVIDARIPGCRKENLELEEKENTQKISLLSIRNRTFFFPRSLFYFTQTPILSPSPSFQSPFSFGTTSLLLLLLLSLGGGWHWSQEGTTFCPPPPSTILSHCKRLLFLPPFRGDFRQPHRRKLLLWPQFHTKENLSVNYSVNSCVCSSFSSSFYLDLDGEGGEGGGGSLICFHV